MAFTLANPEDSLAGEVLPCLDKEKFRLSEPGIAAKCCFSVVLYVMHDYFWKSS